MSKKKKKVYEKEQEIESKANKSIISWWEKISSHSKVSYFILIALLVITLIVIFVILAITKVI